MITQHTQVNITCWKIYNILLGLYSNPPMKAAPCFPFGLIWKAVNFFVQMKVKFPIGVQFIVIGITFLWGFWWF